MTLITKLKILLAKATKLWVKPAMFPRDKSQLNLQEDTRTFYVLENSSAIDQVAAQMAISERGLPKPSSQKQWCSLTCQKGPIFAKRRVYSNNLFAEMFKAIDNGDRVQLIPISIFWGREPDKNYGFWRSFFSLNRYKIAGGLRRFFATIAHRKYLEVHLGSAFSLNDFLAENDLNEKNKRKLHRLIRIHFSQVKNAVLGPNAEDRTQIIQQIVSSAAVQSVIQNESHNEEERQKLAAKAFKYGDEIAANYTNRSIRIFDIILTWFWNKIYDGVHIQGIDKLRHLGKDHELVYLPCHRSHIDYLLISYILYKEGIMPPHIAAGINLNMPLVGRLLRGSGAFFIRRSFKGNKLYTAVFNEYLHSLLKGGFPVEFYIEGGRSRTGRSLPPKTGMLALMIKSYLRNHHKPIVLVPTYVGYEKVLEGRTYLGELRGKSKKSESIFDIFKVFSALKQRFGQVHACFGEPIYLDDFLDANAPNWRSEESTNPEWLKPVTDHLGDCAVTAINNTAHVNSVNLVSTALLASPRQCLGSSTLEEHVSVLQSMLQELPYSSAITVDDRTATDMITHCESLELIEVKYDSMGSIVMLDEINSVLMSYYRNNTQHIFALPALFAYALQTRRGMTRSALIELVELVYPYLQRELFLNSSREDIASKAEETLDWLLAKGLIVKQGTKLRAPFNGTPQQVHLRLLSGLCAPIIERFYIVISLITSQDQYSYTPALLESKSVEFAERLSLINGIHSPEYFDKRLFKGFITALLNSGVISSNNGLIQYSEQLISSAKLAERVVSNDVVHNLYLANAENIKS